MTSERGANEQLITRLEKVERIAAEIEGGNPSIR
jgi:hypothetical protein